MGPSLDDGFWDSLEGAQLLGGGLITVLSFLVMANIAYRAIFLVLTLPGFFALRHRGGRAARLAGAAIIAVPFCLNTEIVRALAVWPHDTTFMGQHPEHIWDDLQTAAFFLLREAVWWSLAALLLGIIFAFLRQAPVFAKFTRRRAGPYEALAMPAEASAAWPHNAEPQ